MKSVTTHFIFLTPGFPESEKDSTTIPALQTYLKKIRLDFPKIKMTVISFQFPFSSKPYSWNDIDIIPLNGKNKKIKKLWVWTKVYNTLKAIHQKYPITVVHSFWIGECSFIGQKFSYKYNVPHVVTVMGQDARIKNKYVKRLKSSKTKIVTLSTNHHDLLFKNHGLTSVIIPWGLNTKVFPKIKQSKIDILGVGSLNEVKNYHTFLNVIFELKILYPTLKVEIIGEGNQYKKLKKIIIDLKLSDVVKLIGKLDHKKVLSKMAQSKVLLHTSIYESFGYVFLEALYSGMQIVSLDVGTAQEINKKWVICSSVKEMVHFCDYFLSQPNVKKDRIELYKSYDTINSYLKLYNA